MSGQDCPLMRQVSHVCLPVCRSPPAALMSVLEASSEAVELILRSSVVGETMVIEPYIPEHGLTTAYLLTWRLLLTLFRAANSQVTHAPPTTTHARRRAAHDGRALLYCTCQQYFWHYIYIYLDMHTIHTYIFFFYCFIY